MSVELQIALAPARTFRQLVADGSGRGWRALAAPLAFTLLLTGAVVAILATRRVDLTLVATTLLTSSLSLLLQLVAAVVLVASVPTRPVSVVEALSLFFRAHAPWSLWMLALAGIGFVTDGMFSLWAMLLGLPVPIGWTALLVAAFSREVLGTTVVGARVRSAVHFLVVWSLALFYIAWAAGGEGRIVTALAP